MGEKGVLRYVKADSHRSGIAIANLEVDVAHCRIKCVGVSVGDVGIGRHCARRRKGDWTAGTGGLAGPAASEHYHDSHTLLEARCMGRQHEDWTRRAVSDEPHAGPDVDRARERVTACGNKDNALSPCACRLVDRGLKSSRTVSVDGERVKIDGL